MNEDLEAINMRLSPKGVTTPMLKGTGKLQEHVSTLLPEIQTLPLTLGVALKVRSWSPYGLIWPCLGFISLVGPGLGLFGLIRPYLNVRRTRPFLHLPGIYFTLP